MIEEICSMIYDGLYVCEDEFLSQFLYIFNSNLTSISFD